MYHKFSGTVARCGAGASAEMWFAGRSLNRHSGHKSLIADHVHRSEDASPFSIGHLADPDPILSKGIPSMTSHRERSAFAAAVRKQTTSILALAGLAGALLLQTAAPAAASKMSSCQIKHSHCSERCIIKNSGSGIDSCIRRTCDHQNPGCGNPNSGSGGRVDTGTKPPKIAVPGGGRDTTPSRPAGGVVTSTTPRPSGAGTTIPIRNTGVNAPSRSDRGGVTVRAEGGRVRR
jgi:hypothetical protein